MGRRSKRASRCARCRMHDERCLCEHIPRIELKTHLALVMHRREVKKVTATGPLALAALPNSKLYVHGRQDSPLDLNHLHEVGRRVFVLYPCEDARPLSHSVTADDPRPLTLVVPDGSWRQAAKIAARVPGLEHAERVTLPTGAASRWGIRTESKEGGLATFEAIARALGFLESTTAQDQLESLFSRMVQATLASRG